MKVFGLLASTSLCCVVSVSTEIKKKEHSFSKEDIPRKVEKLNELLDFFEKGSSIRSLVRNWGLKKGYKFEEENI